MDNKSTESPSGDFHKWYAFFKLLHPEPTENYEYMAWIQKRHRDFKNESGYVSIHQKGYEYHFDVWLGIREEVKIFSYNEEKNFFDQEE